MWIIQTSDGKTHQITNPERSREAWEVFLRDHYKMTDITSLGIKLPNSSMVTLSPPEQEQCTWFIEKIGVATRGSSKAKVTQNPDGTSTIEVPSELVGEVVGYMTDNYIVRKYVYYSNGLENTRIIKRSLNPEDKPV